MADYEENEPLLTGDEANHEDDLENDVPEVVIPASRHFKRAVRGLTIAISAISGSAFIIFLAIFISVQVSQLNYAWSATSTAIDLGVCALVAFIITTLNLFIQLPILINMAIDLTLSIVTLVFSANAFRYGWPRMHWCPQRMPYPFPPHNDPGSLPAPSCVRLVIAMRVLMGVAAGISFVAGFIFLALLLLRIIAISRTKFWKKGEFLAPGEYNYQLSFTVTKKAKVNNGANKRGRSIQSQAIAVEAPLIET